MEEKILYALLKSVAERVWPVQPPEEAPPLESYPFVLYNRESTVKLKDLCSSHSIGATFSVYTYAKSYPELKIIMNLLEGLDDFTGSVPTVASESESETPLTVLSVEVDEGEDLSDAEQKIYVGLQLFSIYP